MRTTILSAAVFLAACGGGGGHGVEAADFPESWSVKAVHTVTIQWVEVEPDSLPIECGDGEAVGCTVYGDPCTFGAADPRAWGWETATGQRREGTLGHELMHCVFGGFHD